MALIYLLLVLVAATSNVFADDYIYRLHCDGNSYNDRRYCYIPNIDVNDIEYYQVDLLQDNSRRSIRGYGCFQNYYALEKHHNRPAVRVYLECTGYFGIKPKVKGFPYRGGCGQNNYGGFKIINGLRASVCQFPWMAYVKLDWKKNFRTSCGGSIINDRWILTAAHCIVLQGWDGRIPPTWSVYVRTGTLFKYSNFIQRNISQVVIHPQYDYQILKFDIALLRLRKPVKWDSCHAPVCLNTDKNVDRASDLTCRISGWGKSSLTHNTWPKELLYANEEILSRSECNRIYRDFSTDNTLCGRATANGRRGFCAADSGGPLVCKSKQDGRYYQHGVVSLYWGDKFCSMEGLYSSVAGFYDWISRNSNN